MTDAPDVERDGVDKPVQKLGWLRNGGEPGDIRLAKRCGARTRRGGSCCQPAMKNGRCRLHGGKSTGARTPEGKERARLAVLKHGRYTYEAIRRRREAAAARRETRELIRLMRGLA